MSDTKFLLRDARDQINLELRKVSRRLAAEIYAELEAEILEKHENFLHVQIDPDAIKDRLVKACRDL